MTLLISRDSTVHEHFGPQQDGAFYFRPGDEDLSLEIAKGRRHLRAAVSRRSNCGNTLCGPLPQVRQFRDVEEGRFPSGIAPFSFLHGRRTSAECWNGNGGQIDKSKASGSRGERQRRSKGAQPEGARAGGNEGSAGCRSSYGSHEERPYDERPLAVWAGRRKPGCGRSRGDEAIPQTAGGSGGRSSVAGRGTG